MYELICATTYVLVLPVSIFITICTVSFLFTFCYLLRYVKSEVEKKSAMNTLTNLREAILTKEHAISKVESDLKIEKEWRLQLQKTSEADKETLYKLQEDSKQLKDMLKVIKVIKIVLGFPNCHYLNTILVH